MKRKGTVQPNLWNCIIDAGPGVSPLFGGCSAAADAVHLLRRGIMDKQCPMHLSELFASAGEEKHRGSGTHNGELAFELKNFDGRRRAVKEPLLIC